MEETLKHVLEALRSTEELIRGVISEKEFSREKLAALEVKLENLDKDLTQLLHIVRGNGAEGLQIKVRVLEGQLKDMREQDLRRTEEILKIKSENVRGKWGVVASAVAGVLGLAAAVVALLM